MANRVKEDEKNERIIRSLLKLPENRRCINCNSLGPRYVCTNFWTFVCTTCSGIHREFTHRVKSVSMAKFTSQEVAALQGGGNARAKESLFKELDPQRHSFPDNSNIERLRDFIKHAYVDRRYGGERGFEKPPKGEESYENRKPDSYHSGSRSPPYEDTYDRRYSDRPSPGGRSDDSNSRYDERRSPGYDHENQQYGDYRSPARHEVANDWRRDDRFGNGRRPEDRQTSDGDSRSEGRSPDHQKDKDMISPPIVRPVRDILGDNVVPLRIIEPPKANGTRAADGSTNTRRTVSSSSLGSADGNPVEPKRETLASLIDFGADPEPPTKAPDQQSQETFMGQPAAPTSTSGDTNWASFDVATEATSSHFPSNASNIQSVLSQLSNPTSAPGQLPAPLGNMSIPPTSGHSMVGPVSHPSVSVFNGGTPAALPVSNPSPIPPTGQWPSMQHQQHSLFPAAGIQSSAQSFNSTTQTWNSSFAPNALGAPRPQEPQALHQEVKSSGRTALPEDLFAPTYPSFSVPSHGWQSGPPGGMGYAMQYNTAVPIPTYSQSSKLANPFDLHNDPPRFQHPSFPSMASLHGSLPNMPPPSGLMHASSLGTSFPAWTQPHSSPYASGLHSQAPSAASALHPRAYMGQQLQNNMTPSWNQGVGTFGNEGSGFSSMNSNQLMAGGYPAPTPASFTSTGGNPFG